MPDTPDFLGLSAPASDPPIFFRLLANRKVVLLYCPSKGVACKVVIFRYLESSNWDKSDLPLGSRGFETR